MHLQKYRISYCQKEVLQHITTNLFQNIIGINITQTNWDWTPQWSLSNALKSWVPLKYVPVGQVGWKCRGRIIYKLMPKLSFKQFDSLDNRYVLKLYLRFIIQSNHKNIWNGLTPANTKFWTIVLRKCLKKNRNTSISS